MTGRSHLPVRRFKRSLDEHFRVLTAPEREIVRHAQSRGTAFLLYDAWKAGVAGPRRLCVAQLESAVAVHIGRGPENDVVIDWDQRVSGTHAKVEREAQLWFLEDLDSKNGTFVGDDRITDRRRLHDADIVYLSSGQGAPQLEFNCAEALESTATTRGRERPRLTAGEQKLLAAVCIHRLCSTGHEAATDKEMASLLIMERPSIRSGLTSIYGKFDLQDVPQGRKRRRLVAIAVDEGVARREHLGMDCGEAVRRLAADA